MLGFHLFHLVVFGVELLHFLEGVLLLEGLLDLLDALHDFFHLHSLAEVLVGARDVVAGLALALLDHVALELEGELSELVFQGFDLVGLLLAFGFQLVDFFLG